MLVKIKSSYFIKNMLSNLEEGNKLKAVKYNKRLQNNLDINLINYMKLDGKWEEYSNDKLIYKDEYKNGKRNGKGKEYYDKFGDLIYKGEYLNGRCWSGKGKEYNYNGR